LLPLCLTFSFHSTATTYIYTLSLHDALPIFLGKLAYTLWDTKEGGQRLAEYKRLNRQERLSRESLIELQTAKLNELIRHAYKTRSEEHTSELQSRENLVCRLLLEKKKKKKHI